MNGRGLTRGIARAAIRVGAINVRPQRRRPAATRSGDARSFKVYTFVTDERVYHELQQSFAAAGFEAPTTRFVALRDRRTPGGSDPYELIAEIGAADGQPYVILTHQDVRLDQGMGMPELVAALEQLDALDPSWVVAGNAGGAPDLRLVRRVRDPYGGSTSDPLPFRVVSLDENFLVFNPRRRPRSSSGLHGFHFYGTDVCLNAAREGGTAYVIDFLVTHLSHGRRGPSYDEAKQRFLAAWQPRFMFAFLRAPTEILFISHSRLLSQLFGSRRMLAWVEDVVPSLKLDTDADD